VAHVGTNRAVHTAHVYERGDMNTQKKDAKKWGKIERHLTAQVKLLNTFHQQQTRIEGQIICLHNAAY
jgi:hypothetical protein